MFDLGWSKVLILAVVAIVVVGPKELPSLLRTLGQFIAQLRRHAADFRAQFDEAMRSTELDQIRKDVEAIKTDAQASIRGIERSIQQDLDEAKTSVDQAMETAGAPHAADPTASIAPPTDAPASEPSPAAEPAPIPSLSAEALPALPSYGTPAMPVTMPQMPAAQMPEVALANPPATPAAAPAAKTGT